MLLLSGYVLAFWLAKYVVVAVTDRRIAVFEASPTATILVFDDNVTASASMSRVHSSVIGTQRTTAPRSSAIRSQGATFAS